MSVAGGANYRFLGYFGAKCPNGNPDPHVLPVTMTSTSPVAVTEGPPWGPETPTELCRYCWEAGERRE